MQYDLSFFDTDPFEPIPVGTMSIWPFMLGNFVEIEGPNNEEIADIQRSLGLAELTHIEKSYAQLIKEERDKKTEI